MLAFIALNACIYANLFLSLQKKGHNNLNFKIMTYDIYQLENIGAMNTATNCLAHCKDEKELEEWRKSHEAIKGHYIVHRNWD